MTKHTQMVYINQCSEQTDIEKCFYNKMARLKLHIFNGSESSWIYGTYAKIQCWTITEKQGQNV